MSRECPSVISAITEVKQGESEPPTNEGTSTTGDSQFIFPTELEKEVINSLVNRIRAKKTVDPDCVAITNYLKNRVIPTDFIKTKWVVVMGELCFIHDGLLMRGQGWKELKNFLPRLFYLYH